MACILRGPTTPAVVALIERQGAAANGPTNFIGTPVASAGGTTGIWGYSF